MQVEKYLDYVLQDDETNVGGTSYRGETLREFLEDAYDLWDSTGIEHLDMDEVNEMLRCCGIKPIPYWIEKGETS